VQYVRTGKFGRIIISGHSNGGGLAQLQTVDLLHTLLPSERRYANGSPRILCITFGSNVFLVLATDV
jgi:hypothetical protein